MEVAPFFVDFHHFLSIFAIYSLLSRFTFCRDLRTFPQILFGQNSLLRNITRFLHVWEGGLEEVFLFLLTVALPAIVLVVLKIRLHLPDMTVTDTSQGLVSERVSLHIWPAREPGKRIGLALAALHLVLYSSILA